MASVPGVPPMLTVTRRLFVPAVDSTVTDLVMVPLLPARLTLTSIGPPCPGGITHGVDGSFATVHPHEVRTDVMETSEGEVFVR